MTGERPDGGSGGEGTDGGGGDPGDANRADDVAAVLERVVFSYDRDATLPSEDELAAGRAPDDRDEAVLRGIEMAVPRGSFTVVMGASGGGKSTLLRTLNGIIPDFIDGTFAGDVEVLSTDVTEARVSEMAEHVGMVLQDYESQLFGTSVESEVAFGPENLAVPPREIGPRIDRALDLVGLTELDRRREPAGLSGGQKQRLVAAGVVAMHPELLVLDEPTSDLDPKGTRDLLEVVSTLTVGRAGDGAVDTAPGAEADGGTAADADETTAATDDWAGPETIVMVTHKIEEALLADRAVLLDGGRVATQGPVEDVFTDVDSLRDSRVAVPPLVEAFDRLGWPRDDLPLVPDEAVSRVRDSDLTWVGHDATGPPAGTGDVPRTGDPLFDLRDVVYAYDTDRGPVRAVDGVDLSVHEGEVLALVGHNGSGKTTLAKHLNGLHEPDSGSVTYHGRPVAEYSMAEIGREVGFVFQNPDHQIFAETVEDEVAFGPENFGIEGEALDERVRTAVETVGLDGLEEADPFTLSKGQRQRVALAGILATDPDAIVFDEPTTGLDAAQQERFMSLVARLNREAGLTVVMVTHDMEKVARYASRVMVLADGETTFEGSVRDLFADEERLAAYDLRPPHVVETSNRLREGEGTPALSVEELVAGLGGRNVAGGSDDGSDDGTGDRASGNDGVDAADGGAGA